MLIEPETVIGIAKVRQLTSFLTRKALGQNKAVFILSADRLTLPAQNALLKTLEEPPAHSTIVLSAPNSQSLLATIVSRCQVIHLGSNLKPSAENLKTAKKLALDVCRASLSQRLKLAQKYSNRKDLASATLTNQLVFWRQLLTANTGLDPVKLFRLVENIDKTRAAIDQNINPQLALESLFLHYPESNFSAKIDIR